MIDFTAAPDQSVAKWLADKVTFKAEFTSAEEWLYWHYREWCVANGIIALDEAHFAGHLALVEQVSISRFKTPPRTRLWVGLGLHGGFEQWFAASVEETGNQRHRESLRALMADYREWFTRNSVDPLSIKEFAAELDSYMTLDGRLRRERDEYVGLRTVRARKFDELVSRFMRTTIFSGLIATAVLTVLIMEKVSRGAEPDWVPFISFCTAFVVAAVVIWRRSGAKNESGES